MACLAITSVSIECQMQHQGIMKPCRLLVCQRNFSQGRPSASPHSYMYNKQAWANKLGQTLKSLQTEHNIPDGIACSLLQMGFRLKLIGRCIPIDQPLAASLAATRTPFMLPTELAPMFLEAPLEPLRSLLCLRWCQTTPRSYCCKHVLLLHSTLHMSGVACLK